MEGHADQRTDGAAPSKPGQNPPTSDYGFCFFSRTGTSRNGFFS